MKKIDLHIHTLSSEYEAAFDFSMETLKKYVELTRLDVIAITNHNLFDKSQYEDIVKELNCDVLPGVEVDLESSHILVIVPKDRLDELNVSCAKLKNKITGPKVSIKFDDFINIFPNYRDYILIPHYKKEPCIKTSTLTKFGGLIKTGEVKSPKKFSTTKKNESELVPVYFSDFRSEVMTNEELNKAEKFPAKYTYVDIINFEFGILKNALTDREKVYLSNNKKIDEFAFLNDGTLASTGLNVILGKRSSGKTYNLKKINSSNDHDNIKFVKQFSLTGNSEEEKFSELVLAEQENVINEYLSPLDTITMDILKMEDEETSMEDYIASLKDYANSQSLKDSYSETKLFKELPYNMIDKIDTPRIINSIINLLNSEDNRDIIEKYISRENLIKMFNELVLKRRKELYEIKLKNETDRILLQLKSKLTKKSALPNIKDVNLFNLFKNKIMRDNYNKLCLSLMKRDLIYKSNVHRFELQVFKRKINGVKELKNLIDTSIGLGNIMNYLDPYSFIKKLDELGVPKTSIYKGIIAFDVEVVNENKNSLSGGERAEYNLIKEIKNAEKYDILLLDEPEASFDNPFINNYIIDLIKDISKKTTVFITTHNNSLGVLMNPNKLIYTSNDSGDYKVYTGEIGSKEFKTVNNDSLISYDTIMEVMEAGEKAYIERSNIYESFKN